MFVLFFIHIYYSLYLFSFICASYVCVFFIYTKQKLYFVFLPISLFILVYSPDYISYIFWYVSFSVSFYFPRMARTCTLVHVVGNLCTAVAWIFLRFRSKKNAFSSKRSCLYFTMSLESYIYFFISNQ